MFIVKTIVTKPADAAWRAPQVIAETGQTLGAWLMSQDGVISSRTRKARQNVRVNTTVFRDQAAHEAVVAARAENSEFIARTTYSEANGITTVTRKWQLVD